jgi:hypothetical protein
MSCQVKLLSSAKASSHEIGSGTEALRGVWNVCVFNKSYLSMISGSPGDDYEEFAASFILVSCFAYFSTTKIMVTCSSGTSVNFQLTTQCYIPEDRILQILARSKGYNIRDYWVLGLCPLSGILNSIILQNAG